MRSPLQPDRLRRRDRDTCAHVFGATDADLDALADFYLSMRRPLGRGHRRPRRGRHGRLHAALRLAHGPRRARSTPPSTCCSSCRSTGWRRPRACSCCGTWSSAVPGGSTGAATARWPRRAPRSSSDRGGVFLTSTRVRRVVVEGGRRGRDRDRQGHDPGAGRRLQRRHPADRPGADRARISSRRTTSTASAASNRAGPSPGVASCSTPRVFDAALIPVFSDQSWLDTERFDRMEAGDWPDVPLIAVDVASEFDPGLVAEPGHQVANIQVFVSADPDSPMGDEAVRRARGRARRAVPRDAGPHDPHRALRRPPDLADDPRRHDARARAARPSVWRRSSARSARPSPTPARPCPGCTWSGATPAAGGRAPTRPSTRASTWRAMVAADL